jgi:hypothetical protein
LWSQAECRLADRIGRRIAAGKYRSVPSAVEDFQRGLALLKVPERHTERATAFRLRDSARAAGWIPVYTWWTLEERRVSDRFARDVVRGKYPNAFAALTDCRRALLAAGLPLRHSDRRIQDRLTRRSFALGRPPRYKSWNDHDAGVADRFVRALMNGRYPTLASAAAACERVIGRGSTSSRRSVRCVADQLRTRARAFGWRSPDPRWTPQELRACRRWIRSYERHRRARRYGPLRTAATGLQEELANLGSPRTYCACVTRLLSEYRRLHGLA